MAASVDGGDSITHLGLVDEPTNTVLVLLIAIAYGPFFLSYAPEAVSPATKQPRPCS